jgi:hypothetical protein
VQRGAELRLRNIRIERSGPSISMYLPHGTRFVNGSVGRSGRMSALALMKVTGASFAAVSHRCVGRLMPAFRDKPGRGCGTVT